jgi:hypothetical protein
MRCKPKPSYWSRNNAPAATHRIFQSETYSTRYDICWSHLPLAAMTQPRVGPANQVGQILVTAPVAEAWQNIDALDSRRSSCYCCWRLRLAATPRRRLQHSRKWATVMSCSAAASPSPCSGRAHHGSCTHTFSPAPSMIIRPTQDLH